MMAIARSPTGASIDPRPARPSVGEIHLWSHGFRGGQDAVEQTSAWLDADEKRRATRFALVRARQRFIMRHGFVRGVISEYLSTTPGSIGLERSEGGKPWCIDEPSLCFNVSSAGDTFVLAIAATPIGIDIETVRKLARIESTAGRWLTANEGSELAAKSGEDRHAALIATLVRKEAVLKAAGSGLAVSPERVEVGLPVSGSIRVVVPSTPPSSWWVKDLAVPGRLVCAVAASVPVNDVTWRRWTSPGPDSPADH